MSGRAPENQWERERITDQPSMHTKIYPYLSELTCAPVVPIKDCETRCYCRSYLHLQDPAQIVRVIEVLSAPSQAIHPED